MPVAFRQVAVFALLLAGSCVPVVAQAGIAGSAGTMALLSVTADVTAAPQGEPSKEDALQAVERILALWPQLVGTLPAGDPRYNVGDIGHIAYCTGAGTLVRGVMVSRMVNGMKKKGITVPENATSGSPRPVDLDNNGGKARAVTRAQLELLAHDTDTVRAYFDAEVARTGKARPANPNGLSVADWTRIQAEITAMEVAKK